MTHIEYLCQACGHSFSTPVGVACPNHHPRPVEIGHPTGVYDWATEPDGQYL